MYLNIMNTKILITGGNGNIAKIIRRNLSNKYIIYAPNHSELDILNYNNLLVNRKLF